MLFFCKSCDNSVKKIKNNSVYIDVVEQLNKNEINNSKVFWQG